MAFGTIATLEELLRIHFYKDSTKDLDLSEAHCSGVVAEAVMAGTWIMHVIT